MKIRIFLLSLSIAWISEASGQTDQSAVKILDKFSSGALSAPSISMKFKLANDDLAEFKRYS